MRVFSGKFSRAFSLTPVNRDPKASAFQRASYTWIHFVYYSNRAFPPALVDRVFTPPPPAPPGKIY